MSRRRWREILRHRRRLVGLLVVLLAVLTTTAILVAGRGGQATQSRPDLASRTPSPGAAPAAPPREPNEELKKYDVLNPEEPAPRVRVEVDAKKNDGEACRIAASAQKRYQDQELSRGEFEAEIDRAKSAASNERMVALLELVSNGADAPWCPSGPPPTPEPKDIPVPGQVPVPDAPPRQ